MKTLKINYALVFTLGLLFATSLKSGAVGKDTITALCAKNFEDKFISDGQQYQALLFNSSETAEFTTTLYGGATYRVAACSGLSNGNLVFWIYDSKRNLLFTNKDFANAPFWDFKVNGTIDCIIEAKLTPGSTGSGKAVILIGFKSTK